MRQWISHINIKRAALALGLLLAVSGSEALAQSVGTSYAPLSCPTARQEKGCTSGDVKDIKMQLVQEQDTCLSTADTGRSVVDVTYSGQPTRYDLYGVFSMSGQAVGGGSQCAEVFLGDKLQTTQTSRMTLTYKCVDSNNDGTIDVSTVFNWDVQDNTFVAPTTTAALNTPKCNAVGFVNINGLASPPAGLEITGPSGGAGSPTSAISVDENQTEVTQLTASVPVTWSITGGADASMFNIAADGTITFLAPPDYELPADADTNNTYVLVVTATDANNNVTTQEVTVTVLDVAETDPLIQGPSGLPGSQASAISVNENQTAVSQMKATSATGPISWAIVSGADASLFQIDSTTGVITFLAPPDYELPGDTDTNNAYVLIVQATDANNNTHTQEVTVTVLDLDDTGPQITGPSGGAGSATSAISVEENHTEVTQLTADEPVTWSITGGADANLFQIDPSTGAIIFIAPPDYEAPGDADTNNSYVLIVTATDANNNTTTQEVTVTVLDLAESDPLIQGPSGSPGAQASAISVDENQTAVTLMKATSATGPISWAIAGGADASLFQIDPTTGVITFLAPPDYELPGDTDTNNTYVLIVEATDANNNTHTQEVTVTVLDLNDTAPVITGPSGGAGSPTSAISVDENQTAVTRLTADEPVTWSITGGADAGKFTIAADGTITFLAAPDYELPADADTNNTYVLIVTATDANNNFTTQEVTVTVLNLDDTGPQITGPSGGAGSPTSAISVNENQRAVTQLTADEVVTWTITGGADAGKFNIAADGTITFIAAPDYEQPTDAGTNNTYVLIVTATDANNNVTTQEVTVTVLNVDDVSPVITGPSGGAGSPTSAISVNENQTAVTQLTADEPVTWAITGGPDAGKFNIAADGTITFVAPPDYELPTDADTNNTYVLIVTVTDANNNTSTQEVTVTVLNLDDAGPVITGPSGGAGSPTSAVSVDENQTTVTQLTADEPVTWAITGGPDAGKFNIAADGTITFVAPPDYELPADGDTNNTYVLIVTATDGDGHTTTHEVTVTVLNVDDTGPAITGPSGGAGSATSAISVDENQTAVTQLKADEPVTWAITGGPDAGKFNIAADGTITFKAAPDYELPADKDTNNTYVLIVTATDADGNTSTQEVTVTVLNVDDAVSDIRLTLEGPSPALEAGQTSIYTATVTNHSEAASASATTQLLLPPGVDYVSAAGEGWSCAPETLKDRSQLITCTYSGVLDGNGGHQSVNLVVRPSSSIAGQSVQVYASVDPTGGTSPAKPGPQCVADAGKKVCAASAAKVGNTQEKVSNDTLRFMQVHTDRMLNAINGENRLQKWQTTSCYSSLSDIIDATGDATEKSGNLQGGFDASTKGLCRGDSRWNAWAEGDIEYLFGEDGSGTFAMGTLGLEYLLNERLLLGFRASADYLGMNDLSDSDGSIDGNGWLAGPYVSAEVVDDVFLQVTALYGQGYNNLDGTYNDQDLSGDFTTQRFFVEAMLSGETKFEDVIVKPAAAISFGQEWHDGFSAEAKDGRDFAIDSQDYSVGRLTLKSEFAVPLMVSEDELLTMSLTPVVSWDFVQSGTDMFGEEEPEAWRAGIEAALLYSTGENTNVNLRVGYDGILNPNWSGLTGSVELSYKW